MESTTLLDWLSHKYPLAKRQTLRRMVESGRVRINGARAVRAKDPIGPDDKVEVSDRPAHAAPGVESGRIPFGMVFEDDDILAVDKPPGMLTSTVPRERRPTLLAAVREYVKQQDPDARVGLIHRLDRDASGLLIFSKNDAAYRSLKSQFFHHTVVREYRAVVHGKPNPPADRIDTRLVERADGTVHSTRESARGERAISEYEVIKSERKLSLLRVKLETGRKHQIRVHLAGRGTPIVGDTVYGPKDAPAARLMLAATRLVIQHPRTAKRKEFTLPVPQEFPMHDG